MKVLIHFNESTENSLEECLNLGGFIQFNEATENSLHDPQSSWIHVENMYI